MKGKEFSMILSVTPLDQLLVQAMREDIDYISDKQSLRTLN